MGAHVYTLPPIRTSGVRKFGYNASVDAKTGADEDVIGAGATQYWAAAASIPTIVSSLATDIAVTGSGARTVGIEGLDANYNLQSETVIMNGDTPVNLAKSYIRVHRAYVRMVGATGTNDGNITIADGSGTMAYILAGFGQTTQASYTVPAEYRGAYLSHYSVSVAAKVASFIQGYILVRSLNEGWRVQEVFSVTEGKDATSPANTLPAFLSAKSDIRVCVFDASADSLPVRADFDLIFEP